MSEDDSALQSAADPVAAARAKLAAEGASSADDVRGLKRQVRALWIVSAITIALVVVLAVFSLGPRLFGLRTFGGSNFPGQPGQFQRGTQGAGQPGAGQQPNP